MSFQDDLDAELAATRKGPSCGLSTVLAAMNQEDREALTRSLAEPSSSITHAAISRVLARRGVKVSANTIGRHRRGDCGCP